jgi:hypothetical protein
MADIPLRLICPIDTGQTAVRTVKLGGGESVMCQHVHVSEVSERKTNQPSTNPHVEYPSRSDFIIAIAACTRGLPLMPHHRNGRTGRDRVVRAEPGASPSAWLARGQADHGGHRSVLLTWERGEVANMIYCASNYAGARVCVRIVPLPLSYCPPLF